MTARTVLVKNNLANQKFTFALLERLGHCMHVASPGEEAREGISTSSDSPILLDYQRQRPVLNRHTTVKPLPSRKGTEPHVPVTPMTTHAIKGDKEICLAAGMEAYFTNPIIENTSEHICESPSTNNQGVRNYAS